MLNKQINKCSKSFLNVRWQSEQILEERKKLLMQMILF